MEKSSSKIPKEFFNLDVIKENKDYVSVCEFIPNQLYFVTVRNINMGGSVEVTIPSSQDIHYFNTDTELTYQNFYSDFGPLNIICLYRFCKKLTNKLSTYSDNEKFYDLYKNSKFGKEEHIVDLKTKFAKSKIIIYYTSTNNEKRANAAFLMAAYSILYLGFSPRRAYKTLHPNRMFYRPFQDASVGYSPFKLTIKDCLYGVHKAASFGFFNFNDFDVDDCSYHGHIDHGDMNWILPNKFLAFPGPVDYKNYYYHHPKFYVEYFLSHNVSDVVRLNQKAYNSRGFTRFGLNHHELYMPDGGDPPAKVLKDFLSIAEKAHGAVAVHCKAGLGRTGTLIAAYIMKHYRMGAKETIAWTRLCRPGSVIGHQQAWLECNEQYLWHEGNHWRNEKYGRTEIVPFLPFGIYSKKAPKIEVPGLREYLYDSKKLSTKLKNKKTRRIKLQNILQNAYLSAKKEAEKKQDEKFVETIMPKESIDSKNPSILTNPVAEKYFEKENQQFQNEQVIQNHQYDRMNDQQDYQSHQYNNQQDYQSHQYNNQQDYQSHQYNNQQDYQSHQYNNQSHQQYQNPETSNYQGVQPNCNQFGQNYPPQQQYQYPNTFQPHYEPHQYAYPARADVGPYSTQDRNITNNGDVCSFTAPKRKPMASVKAKEPLTKYSKFSRHMHQRNKRENLEKLTNELNDLTNSIKEKRVREQMLGFRRSSSYGLILRPDDVDSWVKRVTSSKKSLTQGDRLYAIKKSQYL